MAKRLASCQITDDCCKECHSKKNMDVEQDFSVRTLPDMSRQRLEEHADTVFHGPKTGDIISKFSCD